MKTQSTLLKQITLALLALMMTCSLTSQAQVLTTNSTDDRNTFATNITVSTMMGSHNSGTRNNETPCLPIHGLGDNQGAWCGEESVTQSTELVAGWNWFSIGVDMGDAVEALQALEEALNGNGLSIKIGGVTTEYDEEWGWFGDLDDIGMEYSQMCMIQTSAACTVVLEGAPINPADYEITINPGWNWIGFPSAEEISVEVALSGFTAESGDLIKCGGIMTEYDVDWGWFGDIETLEPGNGYMYYSNSNQTKTLVIQTSLAKTR